MSVLSIELEKFYMQSVNLRVTGEKQFWGSKNNKSLYLWATARKNDCLKGTPDGCLVMDELFSSKEDIKKAHNYCREKYYKYLPILSEKLNEMHQVQMPVDFWRIVFGFWLYRHICVTYDRFCYLETLPLEKIDLKLLSRKSFSIPRDHFDYLRYFCNDRGVMQHVSLYYSLFAEGYFDSIDSPHEWTREERGWPNHEMGLVVRTQVPVERKQGLKEWLKKGRRYIRAVGRGIFRRIEKRKLSPEIPNDTTEPPPIKIALCATYYTDDVMDELSERSHGAIGKIRLPKVSPLERDIDYGARKSMACVETEDKYERFLIATLVLSTPQILIEYFRDYYHLYSQQIANNSVLTHIVTESWSSFFPVSIYCAIANHMTKTKLIVQQHGASLQWLNCSLRWLELEACDYYITTGWKSDVENCINGGGAIFKRGKYVHNKSMVKILHICTTRLRYRYEFGDVNTGNAFKRYLACVKEVFELVPSSLKRYYSVRPRKEPLFWDTEKSWEIERFGFNIDRSSSMTDSMLSSRLVLIDHVSTGLGEILVLGVPFVLLYIEQFEPLADEYATLFDDLIDCGVVHKTPESLIRHIENVYDDVEGWWMSDAVQTAIAKIRDDSIGAPEQTINCLLSLLSER